ncbi:hypothetical protein G6F70_007585 [Rhizopus microsporus]|nr:hypothetical protein G6F71_005343 [Rhizopus microsporus]KAG1196268.1 hypothetical protein G6F70_007585 [Rhizopus microsporus]KAG1212049.1 hypothetical protein G6F69_004051 [Rhizopus microsporus]KAG1232323.1 hypothetical protein G6F67_005101 [Rhizopus microsporus]KAG1266162.1 hypothetical protein G6F68_002980 [Rhizopus microsporus]
MNLQTRLQECLSIPQQKEKIDAFSSVLNDILLSSSNTQDLEYYIDAVLNDQVGLVASRQLLSDFIALFDQKITNHSTQKQLLLYAIARTQPRSLSQLREKLADVYESEDDYLEAAKTLQGIPLDSGHRLKIYMRIVKLLLEEDEAIQAETYLNRTALLIASSSDTLLTLTYKLSQARILDAKRKFLEASSKYHELSYVAEIPEDERILCLTAAVQCAVLAGAGPQRSCTLATLYKDERTHQLPSYAILEKTYLERIIRPDEVSEFVSTLKPHHLARLADNTTVFDRAIIEHNMLSASKIYNNIRLDELATLLNVSVEQAEQVAARMIGENRMVGSIDQLEQLISFESGGAAQEEETGAVSAVPGGAQSNYRVEQSMLEIIKWDRAIQTLCHDLDSAIASIQEKYPQYASTKI